MNWKVHSLQGEIAGIGVDEWLGQGFEIDSEKLEGADRPRELTPNVVRPYLSGAEATYLVLPAGEQKRRDQWLSALAPSPVRVAFGRGGLALALAAVKKEDARPVRLVAAEGQAGHHLLRMDLVPHADGITLRHSAMDGRLDSYNDLVALFENAQAAVPELELLMCPDYPRGRGFDRLLPFLDSLVTWNRPGLRWEFPERLLPACGVVGGLWGLYWLLDGYRLGDWTGPGGLLLLDEDSPIAGVTVVSQASGDDSAIDWLAHRPGPEVKVADT